MLIFYGFWTKFQGKNCLTGCPPVHLQGKKPGKIQIALLVLHIELYHLLMEDLHIDFSTTVISLMFGGGVIDQTFRNVENYMQENLLKECKKRDGK